MTATAPDGTLGEVRFTAEDLELFAAASHDRNPLHLSAEVARRTPFGEPVVFGVLGILALMGRLEIDAGFEWESLSADFPAPMYVGIPYAVRLEPASPDGIKASLVDGRRVAVRLRGRLRRRQATAPARRGGGSVRETARDWSEDELRPGLAVEGEYAAAPAALRTLLARLGMSSDAERERQVEILLAASYLVGMEIPGRRSLFAGLTVRYDPTPSGGPLSYSLRVDSRDARFGRLGLSARMPETAHLELKSLLRPDSPAHDAELFGRLVPVTTSLDGQVALVIGASRGLGAALAEALVRNGATVFASFLRSAEPMHDLGRRLVGTPGRLVPVQGDAAQPEWCATVRRRILESHGRLDILICNACPPLRPLWVEASAIDRINEYVLKSLGLVSAPLGTLLDLLADTQGRALVLSSVSVQTNPAEWPHYVAAKAAIEGLVRAAASEYPRVRFLIARPPGLLTDLTNTPWARQAATATEPVAAALVARLLAPVREPGIELIEDFSVQ